MSSGQGSQRPPTPRVRPFLLGLVIAFALIIFPYALATASDGDGPAPMPGQKTWYMPLDLPSGGGVIFEKEAYPEVVDIFGSQIQGNSFYLLVEHSLTMFGDRAVAASEEFGAVVSSLSTRAQFGAVTFGFELTAFRPGPVQAQGAYKASAVDWERFVPHGGGVTITEGLAEIFKIANLDSGPNRTVILIIDDTFTDGDDAETLLDAVTVLNWDHLPIHCYFIHGSDPDSESYDAAQAIAGVTGSTFSPIFIPPSASPT